MNDTEKQIVAWLRSAPFPWMKSRSGLFQRIQAAWLIFRMGDGVMMGFCKLLSIKIQNGEHRKANNRAERQERV